MSSMQRPIPPPASTVVNLTNVTSSSHSSENKKGWKQITNLFNKVVRNIQQCAQRIVNDFFYEHKMSVLFGVEYMSQGTLKGGRIGRSLKIVEKQLEKLSEDNPQNEDFQKALDEITFASSIEETRSQVFERIASKHCAEKIVEKITSLKKGEGIFLPARYAKETGGGHAMMARILCTDATPPKTYTFRIYNEGEGLSLYHRSINDLDNSRLSWENVPENKLTQKFFTDFLNQGIRDKPHSIHTFYDLLNSGLGHASSEKTDWKNLTTRQRGGSCSAQSVLSALRDLLPPKEYQTLKSQLRHHYLYKIYTKITLGDPNPLLPLITLELIHKIEKNKDKAGSFSKLSHLGEVKQEMEKKIVTQSHLTSEDTTNPQKQIAAFFKGNSQIVAKMTRDTLTTVIEQIKKTPCTKKQFQAIRNMAQKYDIDLDGIQERFTRSKGNIQFQNIISDRDAIRELNKNTMLDLLRRITSQEITCKYSEFYQIKARAEKLGIQIPEELDKRFPELDTDGMIAQWETDKDLVNYMDLKTVTKARTIYPISSRLWARYLELTKSDDK